MPDAVNPNTVTAVACSGAPAAPASTFCLFGAAGDLAHRLLIPTLYNLAVSGLLSEDFRLIGIGRKPQTDAAFADSVEQTLRALAADPGSEFGARKIDEAKLAWLKSRLQYLAGDISTTEPYATLEQLVGGANAIFYLALPPALFGPVVDRLGEAGLLKQHTHDWRRLIVEKPFGHDLASARELNRRILRWCEEDQVYRIDHFLGKETVQNIFALRFSNAIFEPVWNHHYIESILISADETLGIGQRGRFYDATGALRDMVPNHLFQLLAMVAMEAPEHFEPELLRQEKSRLMQAVHVATLQEAVATSVRGQFTAGQINGQPMPAYRDSDNVSPQSTTETFAALTLTVDNERWKDVPFHLHTGKALGHHSTEISIRFKPVASVVFPNLKKGTTPANELVIHIQPDEGVSFRLASKVPGPVPCLQGVDMSFRYADYFNAQPTTGYETLLYDCMTGDNSLFQRAEQIEAAWAAVQPFVDAWRNDLVPLRFYAAGSNGPAA